MRNEKVIQVISTGDTVYGLTESGKFTKYDRGTGRFVLISVGEVFELGQNNAVQVSAIENKPQGMYREREISEVQETRRLFWVWISVGIAGTSILLWLKFHQ